MSRWSDVVYLLSETMVENEMGDIIPITDSRMVYANKNSVRQSEFYQSQALGLRPELVFEVRSVEYAGEPKAKYEEKTYRIIRTFNKGEITELICEGVVGNGNA